MKVAYYLVSFLLLLVSTILAVIALVLPDWIRAYTPLEHIRYGLYQRCERAYAVGNWKCEPFPTSASCEKGGEKGGRWGEAFCTSWESAGYTSQLSLAFLVPALLAILVVACWGRKGGKKRREGWGVVASFSFLFLALQVACLSLVLHAYRRGDHYGRFPPHSEVHLARSFWLGLSATIVDLVTCIMLVLVGVAAKQGKPWAKEEKDWKQYGYPIVEGLDGERTRLLG